MPIPSGLQIFKKREPFFTVSGNADWCIHNDYCEKQYGYLKKLKMDLPFDPPIPLLGIYLKEPKTLIQKNISTLVFIATPFTIAKIWKWPKCPSVDERIKHLWDIYTMEYLLFSYREKEKERRKRKKKERERKKER